MPTNTFWSSDDKIPISQTKVAIPSENGLSYNGGQRVLFTIPASTCEYFNPVNTLLECNFEYSIPTANHRTRLQLDPHLGGSVLIRHIRLYANSAEMPLLEEVQNCNILAGLRYDYDKNDNATKKRAMTEAVGPYDPKLASCFKNFQHMGNSTLNNQCFSPNISGSEVLFGTGTDPALASVPRKVKLLLPLHQSGIFGSSVVFPNHLVGGLRIELVLAEAKDCLCQLPQAQLAFAPQLNPLFHSISGDIGRAAGIGAGSGSVDIYVSRLNNYTSAAELPFCVGESISIKDLKTDTFCVWKKDVDDAECIPVIKSITDDGAAEAGAGLIKITFTEKIYTVPSCNSATTAKEAQFAIYSTSLNAAIGGEANDKDPAAWEPTITVSNAQLLVEKVEMPSSYTTKMVSAMKSGGTINYDFLTFTNYLYSQLSADRIANIRVPIMNKRCKGVLAVPVDGTVYSTATRVAGTNGDEGGTYTNTYFIDREGNEETAGNMGSWANYSRRSGLTGIADGMTNYQWFYDGKLNPSRKVDVKKISNRTSISQQSLVENEKTLAVCGIPPHSFSEYQRNFFISRAVGIQQGVSDLSTTDFNLQVEYTEAANAPTKNKTWNLYIGHLRRLLIKGDSVQIEV
tara:strand:- start:88 stop:1971 length:1884 start_codon:yes stop_codon:yes gene_type:complete